jgi:hypothetical protein
MILTEMSHRKEMVAVLTAVLLSPLVPIFHIALVRILKGSGAVKLMMLSFVFYGFSWLALNFYLNNCTLIPFLALVTGYSMVGFLCLGYAEAFSMICRGFSLRIITDIFLHKSLTLPLIIERYAEGRGVDWLLKKRIQTLESLKMVKLNNEFVEIIGIRGNILGETGLFIKRVLKMGAGG